MAEQHQIPFEEDDWGLIVNPKSGKVQVHITAKEHYQSGDVLGVLVATIRFLGLLEATLQEAVALEASGGKPPKKEYLN